MKLNAFYRAVLAKNWLPPKLLFIMKLTTIILFISLMQASAIGYGQKITLKQRNASIEKVLNLIKQKSGYVFFYNRDDLPKTRITVEVKNATIEETLKESFKGIPVEWEIVKNNIVLTRKSSSFLDEIGNILNIQEPIKGKILDENRQPVLGATITEKGTNNRTSTDLNGEFILNNTGKDPVILISFIGYVPVEYKVTNIKASILIILTQVITKLNEVNVVSTGYQDIPKERSTGSFEKVDNQLFNRSTSTNILSRLEGITTGLLFSKQVPQKYQKYPTIRGIGSLSEITPLIVVDNFPYEGDINNINPNDVESINILKDAAAASIWGTRAGNGVIVINTKKGKFGQPLKVSLNTNVTVSQKPNLLYLPVIKSTDYVDIEESLYNAGVYDDYVNQMFGNISPVIQILDKRDKGSISPSEATRELNVLRQVDSRSEYMKYLFRKSVNQQYALNVSGGSKQISYYLSGGLDKNLNSHITSDNSRLTLRSNVTFRPVKDLEVESGVQYTETKDKNIGNKFPIDYGALNRQRPYIQLKDNNGNPLEVDEQSSYLIRAYRDTVGQGRLLDWHFRPLAELDQSSNVTKLRDVLLNVGAKYKINEVFTASVKYQYERNSGQNIDTEGLGSYYTRDLINRFSDWRPANVIRAIPIGDIIETQNLNQASYSLRGQLDAKKTWGEKHELVALGGAEIRQNHNFSQTNRVYGYDWNTLTTKAVDYATAQTVLAGNSSKEFITRADGFTDRTNRYTSIFANASYTYNNRYTASASARKDATNFFAVERNQKGTPLWSAGLSWIISREPFYDSGFIPTLKLRTTYGYTGNAIPGQSPKAVIFYSGLVNPNTQLTYASILSPPNSGLKWENVRIINLGVDFATKGNRLSGNIEYYDKLSTDVLSFANVDQGSGFTQVKKNAAELHGQGIDINVNSFNIQSASFSWMSNLLFSYNKLIVSRYFLEPNFNNLVYNSISGNITAVEGRDASGIYTYKWAGLDPQTGEPQGYLNGQISKDYSSLTNPTSLDDLEYHGTNEPKYFGAFRNTLTYKAFSISANIIYKFDYKFIRPGISYTDLYNQGFAQVGSLEYEQRWQKPGDESKTNVPAAIYPTNALRDSFYQRSSALVEDGAHLRLQDINLSYTMTKPNSYFKDLKLYANLNNIGIIWKKTTTSYDPDYRMNYQNPRSITFGLSAGF